MVINEPIEAILEKRLYVYRRSYKDYKGIGLGLSVGKVIFTSAGFSGIVLLPLVALSAGAAVIEAVDKALNISERKQEYKMAYKFYKELLNLYKAKQISPEEVYIKEKDFVNNLEYFPREKYIKEMGLNGYNTRNKQFNHDKRLLNI